MLTCLAVLFLALIVLFTGVGVVIGLLSIAAALIIIGVVAALAFTIWFWRIIYPWLVRMGRWSAQLRNIIFLAVALVAAGFVLYYVLNQVGIPIPLLAIIIPFGVIFLFLLLLGTVVWVVRIWRRGFPLARNFFWDLWFRVVALFWKILRGIPLGVAWFLYHPPLRWLIAAFLFYFRGMAAAAAWLLYNPPLRSITIAGIFMTRLIARLVALILYNPLVRAFVLASASVAVILVAENRQIPIDPIHVIVLFALLWPINAYLFVLRLVVRPISAVIYGIMSWWPITGVKGILSKGITTEAASYQDYKYA